MNILIVDDSRIIRIVLIDSIVRYFENHKNKVNIFEAENGIEAIEQMKNEDINIMFLDWNMPRMTGEEVIKVVRGNKQWNNTRIIMATTEGEKSKIIQVIKNGVNGYVLKPLKEENIFKALDTIVSRMSK